MSPLQDKNRMDMTTGPLFSEMVRFSIPLFFTLMLQLLFHAADLIVIGRCCSHECMAAVGSTGALNALLINLFWGLSIGTNVIAANAFGAKDEVVLNKTLHTSMLVGIVGGIIMIGVGGLLARPLLVLMDTPANVLDKAALYVRIYCIGMPLLLIYNFGSAMLRALGDTKRPMIYLAISGFINVPLNIFFVLFMNMDVDGVAWATVISQGVSSIFVWHALATSKDSCKLCFRKLHIHPVILKKMLAIGIPSAAQGSFFSISNIMIQSSVNSFGSIAMAGNAATISLEGMVYVPSNTFHQTSLSFVGQNFGARDFGRVRRSVWYAIGMTTVMISLIAWSFCLLGPQLLAIYNPDPEVIEWGMQRVYIMFIPYALCGWMDVVAGAMRGIGYSTTSAVIVLMCVCVFRIIWILTVFPTHHTMFMLLLCYPISWILPTIFNGLAFHFCLRKEERKKKFAE